jgi:hypothetical protein
MSRDGWRVTIVERSCAELSGGTGVSIDRRLLASVTGMDASRLPVVHVGFPATAWGLLQAALRNALRQRPGVRVRAGCRVLEVRMEENRDEAVVRTTEGDLRADLMVGADGYGSIVRRFVAPEHPHATYSGYLLWRGLVEWFDTSRAQLLRQSGKLHGDVVAGTLTGDVASGDTITELRHLARRWASPWRHAIDRTLDRRDFIGTPVAEYLPTRTNPAGPQSLSAAAIAAGTQPCHPITAMEQSLRILVADP